MKTKGRRQSTNIEDRRNDNPMIASVINRKIAADGGPDGLGKQVSSVPSWLGQSALMGGASAAMNKDSIYGAPDSALNDLLRKR